MADSSRKEKNRFSIKSLDRKKLLIIGGSLAFVLLLLFFIPLSSTTLMVPDYKVKRDNFSVTLTESGEIRAINSVSISAPRVRGQLKIVYLIPQGTYIEPGDTVVRFDPTEAFTRVKDSESELQMVLSEREKLQAQQKSTITKMDSELKSSELSFELSKLNLEQMKFEAEIKQQEAELEHRKNELSYKKAKQDYESQKIIHRSEMNKINVEIEQKRNELAKAKRELEMLTLTAPKEGLVVYERNWSTGRKIAVGDTPWGGMTIVSLPDLSEMESVTYVNEVDVSRVREDQKVELRLDAFQDSVFKGVITEVASLGKAKEDNSSIKVFEIHIKILEQSEILKPGMTTGNKIIINEIPDVIYVPQESVFEKDGKKIVYLKNGSSYDETEVTVGEKSEDYVVISSGLNEGDVVALRDPNISLEEEDNENGNASLPQ